MDLTLTMWISVCLCAFLIGMSKTGLQGIATLVVPVLAVIFGGKESTGIVLPMLCLADIIAVIYYRRSCEWRYIIKLVPSAIAGFFVALAVDSLVPADQFKKLMALCIFIGFVIMYWSEKKGSDLSEKSPWWFAPLFGLLGGFATMIGNAAGPIMAVYMLSMRLPKLSFVGTSAWFFMIINYLKLPLQIWVWDNIGLNTLKISLAALPFIIIGAFLGIVLVKRLPEQRYRTIIIWLTIASTIMLLF